MPKTLSIGGVDYKIRTDFRDILKTISALDDNNLSNDEKVMVVFFNLYPDYSKIPKTNIVEAIEKAYWFIDGGRDYKSSNPKPSLMNWEQDFPLIIAPINRTLGYECRDSEYLHWWTFLGAYNEIGECSFSTVVSIRNKRIRHKKLEKWEREFYEDNKELVDLKVNISKEEEDLINDILGVE
ncbi:MAG: Gp15 family bacteriophage protein [Firmicutes bacterium]|nr:Gp15 family bacteriophage protein [Bacillota bacterium]